MNIRQFVYILIIIFLLFGIGILAFNLQNSKKYLSPDIQLDTQDKTLITFSLNSTRAIPKDSSYQQLILEVTIQADAQCNSTNSDCVFNRNNFKLIDNLGQAYTPAGPPLFYIPNFRSRELVISRGLNRNQSETGQLYFIIPKKSQPVNLSYESTHGQTINALVVLQ